MTLLRTNKVMYDYSGIALPPSGLMIHSNQDRIIPHDSFVSRATTYETELGYYDCSEIFV
jgi:hypothetical protein